MGGKKKKRACQNEPRLKNGKRHFCLAGLTVRRGKNRTQLAKKGRWNEGEEREKR